MHHTNFNKLSVQPTTSGHHRSTAWRALCCLLPPASPLPPGPFLDEPTSAPAPPSARPPLAAPPAATCPFAPREPRPSHTIVHKQDPRVAPGSFERFYTLCFSTLEHPPAGNLDPGLKCIGVGCWLEHSPAKGGTAAATVRYCPSYPSVKTFPAGGHGSASEPRVAGEHGGKHSTEPPSPRLQRSAPSVARPRQCIRLAARVHTRGGRQVPIRTAAPPGRPVLRGSGSLPGEAAGYIRRRLGLR